MAGKFYAVKKEENRQESTCHGMQRMQSTGDGISKCMMILGMNDIIECWNFIIFISGGNTKIQRI